MERRVMEDCTALPKGWKKEEVTRKSGLSAGKSDIYYYSPGGKKFRSKPQLSRFLGDTFDLSTFDFRTGKISAASIRKSKRLRNVHYDYSKGTRHDATLILPIRQTASIFKQPVTSITNQPNSKVRIEGKQDLTDQPKQLFWEKRLQGLKSCDVTEEIFKSLELPDGLTGLGPGYTNESLLQSLATNLHLSTQPVTGQTAAQSAIEKNPGVYLNTDQPLCPRFVVTDADIKKQEDKVVEARKKLEILISQEIEIGEAEDEPMEESVGTPSEEPVEPMEEPREPTEEPSKLTEEPREPTDEPSEPTEEPSKPTEEPSTPMEEPSKSTEEPSKPTEEPSKPTEEPREPMEEPSKSKEEPSKPTEELSQPIEEPKEPTEEPKEPAKEPSEPMEDAVE